MRVIQWLGSGCLCSKTATIPMLSLPHTIHQPTSSRTSLPNLTVNLHLLVHHPQSACPHLILPPAKQDLQWHIEVNIMWWFLHWSRYSKSTREMAPTTLSYFDSPDRMCNIVQSVVNQQQRPRCNRAKTSTEDTFVCLLHPNTYVINKWPSWAWLKHLQDYTWTYMSLYPLTWSRGCLGASNQEHLIYIPLQAICQMFYTHPCIMPWSPAPFYGHTSYDEYQPPSIRQHDYPFCALLITITAKKSIQNFSNRYPEKMERNFLFCIHWLVPIQSTI